MMCSVEIKAYCAELWDQNASLCCKPSVLSIQTIDLILHKWFGFPLSINGHSLFIHKDIGNRYHLLFLNTGMLI